MRVTKREEFITTEELTAIISQDGRTECPCIIYKGELPPDVRYIKEFTDNVLDNIIKKHVFRKPEKLGSKDFVKGNSGGYLVISENGVELPAVGEIILTDCFYGWSDFFIDANNKRVNGYKLVAGDEEYFKDIIKNLPECLREEYCRTAIRSFNRSLYFSDLCTAAEQAEGNLQVTDTKEQAAAELEKINVKIKEYINKCDYNFLPVQDVLKTEETPSF